MYNKIKENRLKNKMTQQDLASLLGILRNT